MDHARFSISGTVTRKWVSDSGKYSKLSLSVAVEGGKRRIVELRGFSDISGAAGALSEGANVTVTGDVEMNPLKDKGKNDVKVDGFAKWICELTAREIKSAGGSTRPRPTPAKEPFSQDAGDDLPF